MLVPDTQTGVCRSLARTRGRGRQLVFPVVKGTSSSRDGMVEGDHGLMSSFVSGAEGSREVRRSRQWRTLGVRFRCSL